MVDTSKIIASHLNLEPNRAAVLRDLYRAAASGINNFLVNENMLQCVMDEVQASNLNIKVSPIIAFPIGQWYWGAKKAAIDALGPIQNGPTVLMHSVGPWLDGHDIAKEEWQELSKIEGENWVMTSLSAIPNERYDELADELADAKIHSVILSNGVKASGLQPPDSNQIEAFAKSVNGRLRIVARIPDKLTTTQCEKYIEAGADAITSDHFWNLINQINDREGVIK